MTPTIDKLNIGCGLVTPEGWLNLDGSWNARLARYPLIHKPLLKLTGRKPAYEGTGEIFGHDVRKPLPWKENSFSAIYASHLLEHLHLDEADRLLKECYRVLRPGGVVRVVVPDLAPLIEGYRTGNFPKWFVGYEPYTEQGDRFIRSLLIREPRAHTGGLVTRLYDAMTNFHSHKWMYDASSLAARVRAAGFAEVRNMNCWESRIPEIEKIERRDRVEDGVGVVAEGIKPSA